ncbi:MAG: GtrA family protein [Candidatus Saccharimonadales bacterium]
MSTNLLSHRKRLPAFFVIGLFNTSLDIIIYLLLLKAGLTIVLANIISTSITLAISYRLNKRFTFKDRQAGHTSLIKFLIITLTGLWLLQPIAIYGVLWLLNTQTIVSSLFYNLISKLAATSVSMVWNFVLYEKIVFKPIKIKEKDS